MAVDGFIFDTVIYFPFTVMVRCVRANVYVRQLISNESVMYVLVKGYVFEFIWN